MPSIKAKIKNKKLQLKAKTKKMYKGGVNYSIGSLNVDKNGYMKDKQLINKFNELSSKIDDKQNLPILHMTNLDMVSIFPNRDKNYIYHSLLIAQIDKNTTNELDTINWSIMKFINELINKLNNNNTNNPNQVKYALKDVRINDFKFEIKNEINVINLSGNVYISNINKINKQIDKNVYDKLPNDINNSIKGYFK